MRKRLIKILATLVVIGCVTTMVVYSSLADGKYYLHVDELLQAPAKWQSKNLRVQGEVEPGWEETLADQKAHLSFFLQYNGERIKVMYTGPKPDTFRDKSPVIAEGRLEKTNGQYVLRAQTLSAQCPSKYGDRPKEVEENVL